VTIMLQQINLYQPVNVRGDKLLASRTVGIALAAIASLLLIIYAFGLHQVSKLSVHVDEAREQQQKQTSLLTLNAANVTPGDIPKLQAQVRAITSVLSDHKRALQLLRVGSVGGDSGFSERLIALANQHVDGMWLDHIVLGSNNGVDSIGGGATEPELIPLYLSHLAAEPALRGTRVGQFSITGKNASDEEGHPSSTIQFRAINTGNKADEHTEKNDHATTPVTASTQGGQS